MAELALLLQRRGSQLEGDPPLLRHSLRPHHLRRQENPQLLHGAPLHPHRPQLLQGPRARRRADRLPGDQPAGTPTATALRAACTFTNRTLGFVNAPALMQHGAGALHGGHRRRGPATGALRDLICDGLAGSGLRVQPARGRLFPLRQDPHRRRPGLQPRAAAGERPGGPRQWLRPRGLHPHRLLRLRTTPSSCAMPRFNKVMQACARRLIGDQSERQASSSPPRPPVATICSPRPARASRVRPGRHQRGGDGGRGAAALCPPSGAGEGARVATPRRRGEQAHLAADTIVVIDGEILGKPADRQPMPRGMLMRLAGRQHQVITGFCVLTREGPRSTRHGHHRGALQAAALRRRSKPISTRRSGATRPAATPFKAAPPSWCAAFWGPIPTLWVSRWPRLWMRLHRALGAE